jgi:hypothetical protein
VTDSGFGSFELAKIIKEWGGNYTSSMSIKSASWLWTVLSRNIAPNFWRAAIDSNDIVASLHSIEDSTSHRVVYQQVVSTAFKATTISMPTVEIASNSSGITIIRY